MRREVLTDIPIIPDEYGTDCFLDIEVIINNNPKQKLSEMIDVERRFINGLVRYYEPENLLEIGVSGGGGSVVLLDATSNRDNSSLTSIDINKMWHVDNERQVGFVVNEMLPSLPENKWNLITGKDPSEILPLLNKKFDFVIIDSGHLHPVETLNFLSILPFLDDGAIVILHDISLSIVYGSCDSIAARVLWSTVVAEKLVPLNEYQGFGYSGTPGTATCNIGAFQISKDTRKYIRNVFESLMLTWEVYPDSADVVSTLISNNYDIELTELFRKAVEYNKTWHKTGFVTYSEERVIKAYQKWQGKPVVFYGGGQNMQKIIDSFDQYGVRFNFPIWDISAKSINYVRKHKVSAPDFETIVPYGSIAVITIQKKHIFTSVKKRLEDIGFIVMDFDRFIGLR